MNPPVPASASPSTTTRPIREHPAPRHATGLDEWLGRNKPRASASMPMVRCDVCGERPWEFICRVSNQSNRLVNERRYCLVCAQESGEVVL